MGRLQTASTAPMNVTLMSELDQSPRGPVPTRIAAIAAGTESDSRVGVARGMER